MQRHHILAAIGLALGIASGGWVMASEQATCMVGVARIDVTPEFPVRLSGYGGPARLAESQGVEQRLWAKAIAIGSDEQGPAVIVNLETCVLPSDLADKIHGRIKTKTGIPRERFALCATHTHTAPFLRNALPTLFGQDIPADHQERIDRYGDEVAKKLEQVALAALADRRPATLAWGQGKAGFAMNRRQNVDKKGVVLGVNATGPVDHAMPMLRAIDSNGKLRAVLVNYACHCTTLGGDFLKTCGDWAGYAQEYVEAAHPDSVCMVVIGCGADANPEPRLKLDHAKQHGRTIADEVDRLLGSSLVPVTAPPVCKLTQIKLPFAKIPDRQEWEQRAKRDDAMGYQAKLQVARLDRGETLPTTQPYPVQTWVFGDRLAMVFLAGEVVVDYSLRLKQEFDADRLWVTAYANDVPCYIPSRRVLQEGGYEATTSMIYYDRPAPFAEEVEELVIKAVHELMPKSFLAKPGAVKAACCGGSSQ